MILLIFRLVLLIVGASSGYYIFINFIVNYIQDKYIILIEISGIILFAIIGFLLGDLIGKRIIKDVSAINKKVKEIPGNNLVVGTAGLITGIVTGLLVSFALRSIPFVGIYIPIFLVIIFSYSGIILALKNKEAVAHLFRLGYKTSKDKESYTSRDSDVLQTNSNLKPKILDTSSIIDGRIADIVLTGFLEGIILIPGFIVNELQGIADSSDNLKRIRGRTGLDILKKLQDNKKLRIEIIEKEYKDFETVDAKLVAFAKEYNGIIITSDYNLNKVATLKGISVLNINDLANAVKTIILPGETMKVEIIKEGKERDQGVAYLDDGTMIVIEGGRNLLGKDVEITITGILQTPAGRMIFAKLFSNGE